MLALLILVSLLFRISDSYNPNKAIPPNIQATEEEAWLKWKLMEKSMLEGIQNLIQQNLAGLTESDAQIGSKCMSDLLKVVSDAQQLKLWAAKLLDSIGKPPSGLLTGSNQALGNYKECLVIDFPQSEKSKRKGLAPTKGQYCMVEFQLPVPPKPKVLFTTTPVFKNGNSTFDTELFNYIKTITFAMYNGGMRVGLCLPSTCTETDLKEMIEAGLKNSTATAAIYSCETRDSVKMDTLQITIIALLIALVVVVIVCAILDLIMPDTKSIGRQLISAFSFHRNFLATFKIKESTGHKLESLNGIRIISLTWVILGHTYMPNDTVLTRNLLDIDYVRKDLSSQAIANGYLAVETFFVVTGVLVSYNLVKSFDSKGISVFNIPILLVRRIWRLLPPIVLLVGIGVLMPVLGSGPLYQDTATYFSDKCKEHWLQTLFFLQNYLDQRTLCFLHSWYVAVDFQLFLFALLYFGIFFKKQSMGKLYLLFLFVSSVIATAILTYMYELPPTVILTMVDAEKLASYMKYLYGTFYCQLGVYAMALGLGTFMARREKLIIPKTIVIMGWLIISASALTLVYITLPWNSVREPTVLESVTYGTLQRPVWAMCVCWVIFTCGYGYSGLLASALSWNGFQPAVKLSYLMYILHFPLIYYQIASLNGPSDYSHVTLVWRFIATVGLSFVGAIVVHIIFEAPLAEMDKIFVRKWKQERKENRS